MWSARKSGGFNHQPQNDKNKYEGVWNVHNKNKPKLMLKMKNQAYNTGNDKSRKMGHAIGKKLNENLLMSVETDSDCRQVALIMNGNRKKNSRWNSPLYSKQGPKLNLWKPSNAMSGNDYSPANNPSCGYKIIISSGNKYSKDFILNSLQNLIAPDTFVPIMYATTDRTARFYVDDQRIAEKLQGCDKQITAGDGIYLRIHHVQGFPRYELDQTLKDKMTEAIAKKYVTAEAALDMSRFHLNPDLVENYYCSLTRGPILKTALKIVTSEFPLLTELSLDNNQLHNLENLNWLTKLTNLKILGICNNKIKDIDQLDAISDMELEELRLAGNPVCQKYNGRQDVYISDIRNKFPDLMRLDGVVLRAAIGFDLADDRIVMPPAQRLFSPNGKVQEIATVFFYEYFRIFDSENRQPLLDAYDENASFSMTFSVSSGDRPSHYLTNSRNLCRVLDEPRRRKLLKQGRLPIVACISELPKMQHDLNSFTMDIELVTEKMMLVTVTGTFKEIEVSNPHVRYFSRTFIITPKGEGYCIVNEMLQLLNPTKQQIEAFGSSPSTTTTSTSTTSATSTESMIDENLRMQMTVALRERTRMTFEWTVKCLNDVNWNFDSALVAFQECHSRGAIPPDAFEK